MSADPPPFSGSHDPADVTFLLKPVTLAATVIHEKEALIQSGRRHYSEMIASESVRDAAYLALYHAALARNDERLAEDVASLAAHLAALRPGRDPPVRGTARRDATVARVVSSGAS